MTDRPVTTLKERTRGGKTTKLIHQLTDYALNQTGKYRDVLLVAATGQEAMYILAHVLVDAQPHASYVKRTGLLKLQIERVHFTAVTVRGVNPGHRPNSVWMTGAALAALARGYCHLNGWPNPINGKGE